MSEIPIPIWWWVAPIGAIAALVSAFGFYRQLLAASPGDERMQEIAGYVREGAYAYLKRQYLVVGLAFVFLVILLALQSFVLKQQHNLVPFAFLTGGFFSGLSGFIGMNTATLASNRTTQGAKESLNRGLQVAFRAGAVMGLVVVGLGLLDISAWFWLLAWLLPRTIDGFHMSLEQITVVMLTFGMGASTQALFARVGGGIFTKAADVGADLVGKVEAGIPEDDPRNPAVIADNVGDNVGDVAGMGADLYESYCGSILATAALGAAAALGLRAASGEALSSEEMIYAQAQLVAAPMILAGIGILLSILGVFLVKTEEGASQLSLLWALRRGIYGSSAFIVVAALLVCWLVLPPDIWLGVFLAITVGLIVGILIGYFTEYYTSADFTPTKWIADQSVTGPATTIIAGMAQGMLSTWASIAIVGLGTILAYFIAGGATNATLGLYGVGFAAVGMLSTLGVTLATDAYGPIADNAGGNAEMTHQPPEVRQRTDALDSLGNTTAATGKGFAIGSAALTALALLAAFVEEVRIGIQREGLSYVEEHQGELEQGRIYPIGSGKYVELSESVDPETGFYPTYFESSGGAPFVEADGVLVQASDTQIVEHYKPEIAAATPIINLVRVRTATLSNFMEYYGVNLMNPKLLVGVFAGVLMVFVFCGLTMKAVGRAAGRMVEEVRRQFRELNLLTDPNAKADYAECVTIATRGAQREMIVPAILAVSAPLVVGMVLDVSGLMGLLAGALTAGFAMAIFMANSGGAWDNAKKYIEAGAMGGKGSDPHKAAVVGDTVGDPFKDTSGPSLNILIKLMSMVAVVFAGVIVKYAPLIGDYLGIN
ncbi:sodium-translocating pyrophosphatase [Tautonia marina]|uniref:sodium-translocating pyrophosphatase n=1 Tax=Tautonia marina TaxID=2653855 RepID=UPI00191C4FC6|nr:sodium-translocating pyrophosphatase [Tautonia marina]